MGKLPSYNRNPWTVSALLASTVLCTMATVLFVHERLELTSATFSHPSASKVRRAHSISNALIVFWFLSTIFISLVCHMVQSNGLNLPNLIIPVFYLTFGMVGYLFWLVLEKFIGSFATIKSYLIDREIGYGKNAYWKALVIELPWIVQFLISFVVPGIFSIDFNIVLVKVFTRFNVQSVHSVLFGFTGYFLLAVFIIFSMIGLAPVLTRIDGRLSSAAFGVVSICLLISCCVVDPINSDPDLVGLNEIYMTQVLDFRSNTSFASFIGFPGTDAALKSAPEMSSKTCETIDKTTQVCKVNVTTSTVLDLITSKTGLFAASTEPVFSTNSSLLSPLASLNIIKTAQISSQEAKLQLSVAEVSAIGLTASPTRRFIAIKLPILSQICSISFTSSVSKITQSTIVGVDDSTTTAAQHALFLNSAINSTVVAAVDSDTAAQMNVTLVCYYSDIDNFVPLFNSIEQNLPSSASLGGMGLKVIAQYLI